MHLIPISLVDPKFLAHVWTDFNHFPRRSHFSQAASLSSGLETIASEGTNPSHPRNRGEPFDSHSSQIAATIRRSPSVPRLRRLIRMRRGPRWLRANFAVRKQPRGGTSPRSFCCPLTTSSRSVDLCFYSTVSIQGRSFWHFLRWRTILASFADSEFSHFT